jgi:hypothetical protein
MENIQKITLEPEKTIEINGAIINLKIVDMLKFLQSNNESGSYCTYNDGKIGIESFIKDYDDLTIFLASEAGNIEDKNELAAFLCSISSMKIRWNNFYVPKIQQ